MLHRLAAGAATWTADAPAVLAALGRAELGAFHLAAARECRTPPRRPADRPGPRRHAPLSRCAAHPSADGAATYSILVGGR
ncbi:hypothetical protein [Streptomyces sp. NPDC047315]|uniref:hypothetical protein n=1 Tax=Streptomyces sp. NPDC047315 TaxID=3155142 RepID=UPI0033C56DB2